MITNLLQNIPQSRLILYLILLGLILPALSFWNFTSKNSELNELQQTIENVRFQAETKEKKQATNLTVRSYFKNADHFYIDKYVESIPLLSHEIDNLKKVLNQQYLIENEAAKRRLETLQTGNRIQFSEGVVQSYPYFHETTEALMHPVEVDTADISQILSRIEGVTIGSETTGPNRPQLIITDFKIDKKETGSKNEVYLLNMKLLKREYF
jgi:FtsZ-binding cell division protein ZapB